jgi:hypothetical protein
MVYSLVTLVSTAQCLSHGRNNVDEIIWMKIDRCKYMDDKYMDEKWTDGSCSKSDG